MAAVAAWVGWRGVSGREGAGRCVAAAGCRLVHTRGLCGVQPHRCLCHPSCKRWLLGKSSSHCLLPPIAAATPAPAADWPAAPTSLLCASLAAHASAAAGAAGLPRTCGRRSSAPLPPSCLWPMKLPPPPCRLYLFFRFFCLLSSPASSPSRCDTPMEAYLPNLFDMAVVAQIAGASCQRAVYKQCITSAWQLHIMLRTCRMLLLPWLAVCVCIMPICISTDHRRGYGSMRSIELFPLCSSGCPTACRSQPNDSTDFECCGTNLWHHTCSAPRYERGGGC